MKLSILSLFCGLSLLITGMTFACGSSGCDSGGCNSSNTDACDTSGWNDQYAYEDHRSCDCACTDKGYKFNDCMSKSRYCEAFGNAGAL